LELRGAQLGTNLVDFSCELKLALAQPLHFLLVLTVRLNSGLGRDLCQRDQALHIFRILARLLNRAKGLIGRGELGGVGVLQSLSRLNPILLLLLLMGLLGLHVLKDVRIGFNLLPQLLVQLDQMLALVCGVKRVLLLL